MQDFIRISPDIGKWVNNTGCPQFMYEDWVYFYLNVITQLKSGFFKKFVLLLFLYRGEGMERERERNTHVPDKHASVSSQMPSVGDLACRSGMCPTGNHTSDLLACGIMSIPQSYTSQGRNTKSYRLGDTWDADTWMVISVFLLQIDHNVLSNHLHFFGSSHGSSEANDVKPKPLGAVCETHGTNYFSPAFHALLFNTFE